ncbi:adaptor protein MecA [Siminovitchia sediminis]|uniref:Adaptor protein MecA n=1 Tax=Siminovitchia sediminis TaxID=1274353 RepID=A0ABW4KLQ0_9BACI
MKLERISSNKIKYSITFDELTKKGFLQEEILKDSFIWDVLFDEMLDEASRIYEFNDIGAVSIEIFSLTSKELVLILTLEEENLYEEHVQDPEIELHEDILYKFEDFEYIIWLAKRFQTLNIPYGESSLYALDDCYYVKIATEAGFRDPIECLCSEYGEYSEVSEAYLNEYGARIIDEGVFPFIYYHFSN